MELLVVQESLEDAQKLRVLFGRSEAVLEVIYASVYGERWVVSSGNFPQKIE